MIPFKRHKVLDMSHEFNIEHKGKQTVRFRRVDYVWTAKCKECNNFLGYDCFKFMYCPFCGRQLEKPAVDFEEETFHDEYGIYRGGEE